MNYVYPAIFYPETDGKYSVIFPDLNDLATYGNNLADAFVMAQEACGQYLFTSLKDGESLPNPTTINAVKSDDPTAFINLICVNLDNYARAYDDRAVKKTLTIPAWLNTACENYGINYSKVLKDALIAKLQASTNVILQQCHRVFTVVHFLQIFYAVIFFADAEFLGPGHVVSPGDSAFLQKFYVRVGNRSLPVR